MFRKSATVSLKNYKNISSLYNYLIYEYLKWHKYSFEALFKIYQCWLHWKYWYCMISHIELQFHTFPAITRAWEFWISKVFFKITLKCSKINWVTSNLKYILSFILFTISKEKVDLKHNFNMAPYCHGICCHDRWLSW